jgi:hypothetical protein
MQESGIGRMVIVLAWLSIISVPTRAQQPTGSTPAVPFDPIGAIVDAFGSHSVVALNEGTHGNEQGLAFQLSLIHDPRFALRVNDMCWKGQTHVRRVWDDTTQQQANGPMWTGEVPETYRAVRQLNASLPPEHKLRILLGDQEREPEHERRTENREARTEGPPAYCLSVGGERIVRRSFSPLDTRTSLSAVTMTPSTCGRRSISAMPFAGPSTNTPVESASASTARSLTIVTLRQPDAGSPRSGSMMWW